MKAAVPIYSFFCCLLLASLVAMPLAVRAAVHKCTGADGKIVFSDQPCANDQRGGALNVSPASRAGKSPSSAAPKAGPPSPALGSNAAVATYRKGLLAVLSPEFQNMSRRLWDIEDNVAKATPSAPYSNPAGDSLIADFAAKCEGPTRDYLEKNKADQRTAKSKRIACDTKKELLTDRMPKAATLSAQDKAALAALERDYAAQCN